MIIMKSTTKLQVSILALSSVIAIAFFAIFALAPSIFWTSSSDWSGGTFTNVTNITGDLMLNNTIANGTQTIYSWFYNNWSYRKQIIVNGSTALQNDYQIMINLTNRTAASDNFNFARANPQGNDTRFTWLNTSSGLEQNISFWIENWTVSGGLGNATLWVKVPNVTASSVANTTVYMYYGNPSATSASNGTNTFIRIIGNDTSQPVKGAWTLDTNALDRSGNNNDGTLYDGTSYVAGRFGQAISCDGATGYINVPNSASLNVNGAVSVSAWINTTDTFGGIVSKWNNIDETGWALMMYDTNKLNFLIGTGVQTPSDNSINTGTWKFIVGTYNGSTVKLYINGTLDKSFSHSGTTSTTYALTMCRWIGSNYYGGILDEPRVYNQELTQAEITDIYNNYGYATPNYPGRELVRKYASPEPSTLSVGAEQAAKSRGTYLSNTTATSVTIDSITPTWNATNSTNVNFTVEISANNGSSWCSNIINNTVYTSASGCGGIGSGTQLAYRINFSTDNTSRTATLSDITLNYVGLTTLTCDAGGPYLANSSVMIAGNVSDGVNALTSQPVTVQIKNSTVVLNSTVVTSDASGNWIAKLFVNTTNATSVFVNSTYLSVSGNCTYSLSVQAPTVAGTNATCTTNSTACSFQDYPVSGWAMDSATGGLIGNGTVKLSVKETGDTYSTAFGGGYFSISPQFCLSPGVVYSFALSVEGNGKQGYMTYRRAGKT